MKRKNDDVDLSSMSTRGRKIRKRNKFRIAVNIVSSVVLVISILGLSSILALGARPISGDTTETASGLEPLQYSEHEQASYILITGVDEKGSLTDIIMVACIDHEKDTMNILQIPRDLFIGTDIPSGKINAVYGSAKKGEDNIKRLRRRLSSYLGIPLDHYVMFTLGGFRNIVDALGGVEMNIAQKGGIQIEDHTTGKAVILGPGLVTLDGVKAEGFVRKRYKKGNETGYLLGDVSRGQHQRVFYAALAKKLKAMNFSQVTKIATSSYKEINTSMSVGEMMAYAQELNKIDLANVKISSVPGQFCNYKKLSYLSIHKADYVELFNKDFNPYGTPLTVDALKIKELHKVVGQATEPSVTGEGGSLSDINANEGL